MRLLLVGDSVTHGATGDWTWRYRRWQHLRAWGADVELVGPDETVAGPPPAAPNLEYADPAFDRHHAARWGRSFDDTDWPVDWLVRTYRPDVLVELLGVNDLIWSGKSAGQLVADVTRFARAAQQARPGLDLVLGELPQTWLPHVVEYDAALADLAGELTTRSSRVVVARTAAGFEELVDTYDEVHPSARGEVRIAAGVADALAVLGIGAPYPRPLPDPSAS